MIRRSSSVLSCVLALGISACGGAVTAEPDDVVAPLPPSPAQTPPSEEHASSPAPPPPASASAGATPATPSVSYAWVASCPAAPVDAWVPAARPTGGGDDLHAYADAVRAAFVGHWTGEMAVWGATPPVALSFESTGQYSGKCLGTSCQAMIYYGADQYDSPLKRYRLDDPSTSGLLSGTIDLVFAPQASMGEKPTDSPWVPPAGTTVLQKVELDATGNRLRFDLVSHLETGPEPETIAHYDLWRCP